MAATRASWRTCGGTAGDGEQQDGVAGRRGEPVPVGEQRGAQRFGQSVREGGRVRVDPVDEQLGQVGVAAGAGVHLGDQLGPRVAAEQERDLLVGLGSGERAQGQVVDSGQPAQVCQPAVQRVAVGKLGVTQGGQDREPAPGRFSGQVGQHVERGQVRPLQVVDHQDRGGVRAQDAEGGVPRHEQPPAPGLCPTRRPASSRGGARRCGRRGGATWAPAG